MSRQDYSLRRRFEAEVAFRTRQRNLVYPRYLTYPTDSEVLWKNVVVGLTAVKVLERYPLRSGYRIYNLRTNTGTVYHDYSDGVSTASPDYIIPGGWIQDSEEWQTVHHGEVWLIADAVNLTVRVDEVVARKKSPGWEETVSFGRRGY